MMKAEQSREIGHVVWVSKASDNNDLIPIHLKNAINTEKVSILKFVNVWSPQNRNC